MPDHQGGCIDVSMAIDSVSLFIGVLLKIMGNVRTLFNEESCTVHHTITAQEIIKMFCLFSVDRSSRFKIKDQTTKRQQMNRKNQIQRITAVQKY